MSSISVKRLASYLCFFSGFFLLASPTFGGYIFADKIIKYHEGYKNLLDLDPSSPYFPIIVLIAIFICLITVFHPKIGLVVMLLFILTATDVPVGRVGQMTRRVTLRVEDFILLIVTFGWIGNKAKERSLSIIKRSPIDLQILAMSAVIVVATILAYFQGTVSYMNGFFYSLKRLEYFWIFFMAYNIISAEKDRLVALKFAWAVSIGIAAIGVIQFFLFPLSELAVGGSTATFGTGRANTFSDFLLLVIGIMSGLLIYETNKRRILLVNLSLALFVWALFMTKSRGAYVCLPPMFAVLFMITRNRNILYGFFMTGAIFILYAAFSFLDVNPIFSYLFEKHNKDMVEQFSQIGDVFVYGPRHDPSLNSRIVAWERAVDEIAAYPVFGQGCGSKELSWADNQYITELMQTGMLGLLIFLMLNIKILLVLRHIMKTTSSNLYKGLALGFIVGHIGMLGHGITVTNFYTIMNMEFFWLLMALIMSRYHSEKRESMGSEQTEEREVAV